MNMNDANFMDRLLEFGIGMGMAKQMLSLYEQSSRQMMNTMSDIINNQVIPGQPKMSDNNYPPAFLPSREWYVAIDCNPVGPLSEMELKKMLLENKVNKDTLVWNSSMTSWLPIEMCPEALSLIAQLPPKL